MLRALMAAASPALTRTSAAGANPPARTSPLSARSVADMAVPSNARPCIRNTSENVVRDENRDDAGAAWCVGSRDAQVSKQGMFRTFANCFVPRALWGPRF
jgi:hypothetical protein